LKAALTYSSKDVSAKSNEQICENSKAKFMKCYEINGRDVIPGLPVIHTDGRPHVLVGETGPTPFGRAKRATKVFLNDDLIILSHGANRIMSAELSQDAEGIFWLSPEQIGTYSWAIVRFNYEDPDRSVAVKVSPEYKQRQVVQHQVEDDLKTLQEAIFPFVTVNTGASVLTQVYPGTELEVTELTKKIVRGTEPTFRRPFRVPTYSYGSKPLFTIKLNSLILPHIRASVHKAIDGAA